MTIAEAREKCKNVAAKLPRDLLVLAVLLLASSASFGLGFLAGSGGSPQAGGEHGVTAAQAAPAAGAGFVASKNGTKYYPPGCAGAERIAEANRVIFSSAQEAEAFGYQRASGCGAP